MKQRILIGSVCLLLIAGLAFVSFSSLAKNSSESSIYTDKTDSLKPQPNALAIYSFLGLENHQWARVRISINTFSGFDYNPSSAIELPANFFLLSNPDQRNLEIQKFKKTFETQLDNVRREAIGLPKSSIYVPMIRDLNRLSKGKAKNKTGIYFTDCRENSRVFSAYDKKSLALAKEHPEKVRALLEQIEKPGNLNGIKVFLICEPTSDEENYCFGVMSDLFKKILEDAGAKVYVGADLSIGED